VIQSKAPAFRSEQKTKPLPKFGNESKALDALHRGNEGRVAR
jgi:hypothetical protein